MTPNHISKRIVTDRLDLIDVLLQEIRALPLGDNQSFFADRRNVWAAESCLRRSLEALFDLGRHILAKGFGQGISEYKEIAIRLHDRGVLPDNEAKIMQMLAGYRNRLVHFYHELSPEELLEICGHRLGDLELIMDAYRRWLKEHPDQLDSAL
jgi:uncharacterized protein YutE (UPF0331/DUF86 family)